MKGWRPKVRSGMAAAGGQLFERKGGGGGREVRLSGGLTHRLQQLDLGLDLLDDRLDHHVAGGQVAGLRRHLEPLGVGSVELGAEGRRLFLRLPRRCVRAGQQEHLGRHRRAKRRARRRSLRCRRPRVARMSHCPSRAELCITPRAAWRRTARSGSSTCHRHLPHLHRRRGPIAAVIIGANLGQSLEADPEWRLEPELHRQAPRRLAGVLDEGEPDPVDRAGGKPEPVTTTIGQADEPVAQAAFDHFRDTPVGPGREETPETDSSRSPVRPATAPFSTSSWGAGLSSAAS